MKIAILGTRGIPNAYGGFEQCAEYLSVGLLAKGHEVWVYNSHDHPYQEKEWNGVHIIHKFDPEYKVGTAGQFIYDLNCIRDARKRGFDVILQLGYTSSSIWGPLLPKRSVVVTNMDGQEWKRSKYSAKVQRYLKWAEKRAVLTSDYLVSDSVGIQDYLKGRYGVESTFIAYGADTFDEPDDAVCEEYGVSPYGYHMLIARLEPENNIETILDGVVESGLHTPFLVVGKHQTPFGEYLKNKFKEHRHIRFLGGIYNIQHLNNLRYYSHLYFHGHSVGGTNPSLLEAMASQALICANRNDFNAAILGDDAFYFQNAGEVAATLNGLAAKLDCVSMVKANFAKIQRLYTWDNIVSQYEQCLSESFDKGIVRFSKR